ncbi:barstar family protein [Paraclostridium bifermentans]|uniref:barstar family protein n=1 Tax=Paraclostridium bifermentans TaxID=1490 RepID=UPI00374E9E88
MNIKSIEEKNFCICDYSKWKRIKEKVAQKFNDALIVEIEGSNCKDKQRLMIEMDAKLNFPSYFSHNWDSLDECLNDLEWIDYGSLIIVLKDEESLLSNETYNLEYFYEIILDSLNEWNKGINSDMKKIISRVFYVFSTTENVNLLKEKLKKYIE